jgi:bifunctional DNA-binding transcriptional regulator/antitoxin component of YhaV-PrlF toxin-antitoxin module
LTSRRAARLPEQALDVDTTIDRRDAVEKARSSPKYQIMIPKSVHATLDLVPGQDVETIAHGDPIEMIPVRPLPSMGGFLKGIDTTVESESDRA